MARIYIETTVVSFYFNARPEPEMVGASKLEPTVA